MAPFPPDPSVQERPEGAARIGDTLEGSSEAQGANERLALAALIAHPKMDEPKWMDANACDRCTYALAAADAVLAAGAVRVQDDDETVQTLRRALWERSWRHAPKMATEENWAWASEQLDWDGQPAYEGTVRSLLAALRGSVSGGGNATK